MACRFVLQTRADLVSPVWIVRAPPVGPVFVVQWLFDEAQLTVDNIQLTGQPVQEGQWRYIQNLGIELRNTLKDVP